MWYYALRFLEWVGKWSIEDSFFVGLMTVLVKFNVNFGITGHIYAVSPAVGVILSVIVTRVCRRSAISFILSNAVLKPILRFICVVHQDSPSGRGHCL